MTKGNRPTPANRRVFLKGLAVSGVAGLAGCAGGIGGGSDGGDSGDMDQLTIYDTDTTSPLLEGGLDAGVWEEQGIDLTVEYPGFETQGQAVVQGEVNTSNMSVAPHIRHYNRGEDLVLYGWPGSLQGVPGMYTLADSDYESIPDLEGARIGVWSWGSSTVQSFQAIIADEYDLNLRQDFETATAAPPALLGLLDDGELDAIVEPVSLSVSMDAQPDTYRRLARLNDIWEERIGHKLPITAWFSYREWYENNTDLVARFMRGTRAAVEHWRENTMEIMREHGPQSGVESEAGFEVVTELANNGEVFALDVSDDYIDATWKYLELMREQEVIDEIPEQEDILRDPLE